MALLRALGNAFGSQIMLLGLCSWTRIFLFWISCVCVKEDDGSCAWWTRYSMPNDWVLRAVENHTAAADRIRLCVEVAERDGLQRNQA